VAADLLKRRPERSNRQIGGQVGLDHKTIGGLRAEKERRGEIPHVSTRTDTAGRQQPASKPPPEPGKEAWPRQIREQQAPPPAPASDNSAARLRSVAFTLSGNIGPSENIDLTAARNGLREQGELEDVRAKVTR